MKEAQGGGGKKIISEDGNFAKHIKDKIQKAWNGVQGGEETQLSVKETIWNQCHKNLSENSGAEKALN